ncbi:hypothetical protein SNOG_06200 [Parastagonospora nodorum SN15]|uniref:Uncharacterized protein n=1 Tax=Phaeosphaeria nodorum (strain SN15 / ATCC MYA-4574 / FGSC 10173) TaxID=321614 RepID=Q0UPW4_PHANO|nr:hypothetical protein SNOG_06200 [Parastagonospora nodorum SN15]EAT86031.1 hypothetical protein SNOG_06200 [Parastagonospora nodorum SN15]
MSQDIAMVCPKSSDDSNQSRSSAGDTSCSRRSASRRWNAN